MHSTNSSRISFPTACRNKMKCEESITLLTTDSDKLMHFWGGEEL